MTTFVGDSKLTAGMESAPQARLQQEHKHPFPLLSTRKMSSLA